MTRGDCVTLYKNDPNVAPTPFHKAPSCIHTVHIVYRLLSNIYAWALTYPHTEAIAPLPGIPPGWAIFMPRRDTQALAWHYLSQLLQNA